MLASREQLERYLHTTGTVGRSAALDSTLLDDLLAAASSRMSAAIPDRTLEPTPALVNVGTAEAPEWEDTADPVALTFYVTDSTVVGVPDLRELTAATIDGRTLDVTRVQLRRRAGELGALWARFAERITGELELTGRWGPALARVGTPAGDLVVDPAVREACIVWAARAYYNRASRFADNVSDPAGGNVLGYFRNLPPDVKVVLEGLEVPGL